MMFTNDIGRDRQCDFRRSAFQPFCRVPGGLRLGKGDGVACVRLDPCPKFGFVLWRRLALQLSQQARGFPLYLVPASAV